METFQDYRREQLARRVRLHRQGQRDAGLRPIQIWATDTRSPGFAAECKRQCLVVGERQTTGLCPSRRRRAIRMVYGAIDAKTQREVDRALAPHLGLVR